MKMPDIELKPLDINELMGTTTFQREASDRSSINADQKKPDLLDQRQVTHGDFAENARVSQSLKEVMRSSPGWNNLTDIEREAMDMIALKFSRILSGKSLSKEHWEDVVGYGKLVEKVCK